jgi:GAF domain-containing protein
VDRVFFSEGRSVEASVEELLEELSRAAGVRDVMQRTGDGIERAFSPEFCVIYERDRDVFEPTYILASGEFPSIPAANQGIRTLETKLAPIRLDSRGAMPTSAERMDSPVSGLAVIVPLRSQGAPNAFVGIGPKQSGDVYTSTDLSLLSAVAHAVSVQLERGIQQRCLSPNGG